MPRQLGKLLSGQGRVSSRQEDIGRQETGLGGAAQHAVLYVDFRNMLQHAGHEPARQLLQGPEMQVYRRSKRVHPVRGERPLARGMAPTLSRAMCCRPGQRAKNAQEACSEPSCRASHWSRITSSSCTPRPCFALQYSCCAA